MKYFHDFFLAFFQYFGKFKDLFALQTFLKFLEKEHFANLHLRKVRKLEKICVFCEKIKFLSKQYCFDTQKKIYFLNELSLVVLYFLMKTLDFFKKLQKTQILLWESLKSYDFGDIQRISKTAQSMIFSVRCYSVVYNMVIFYEAESFKPPNRPLLRGGGSRVSFHITCPRTKSP